MEERKISLLRYQGYERSESYSNRLPSDISGYASAVAMPRICDCPKTKGEPPKLWRAYVLWKAKYISRFSLVDYDVDFPAPFFLPIFIQKPPSEKNRKAYGLYLYDRRFEPFDVGDGRPRNIKEALKVWDLSNKEKMKDADIARTLYGLKYRHPDKPSTLQRVHDLKKTADTAIRSIYP